MNFVKTHKKTKLAHWNVCLCRRRRMGVYFLNKGKTQGKERQKRNKQLRDTFSDIHKHYRDSKT